MTTSKIQRTDNYCRLAQATEVSVESRRVPAVASTEDVDCMGTVVLASGWDLTRFNQNPVLLYAHDSYTRTPVGRCENVRVEGTQLLFEAVFDDTTPFDNEVFAKYQKGVMRGFSVRFDPVEHRTEPRNGREVTVYTRQVLMEISCAPVPANAGALVSRTDNPNERSKTVKRAEIMKALRALYEGEGEEAEKKAARALYEKMGGADAELRAREAEETPPGDEKKAEGEDKQPESEKPKPAEEQRAAANVALAKRAAELEAGVMRGKVADLVERNAALFTPATKAWALSQPEDVVRSYVATAPKIEQRAAVTAPPTRGENQGDGTATRSEDDEKLDRILGINRSKGDIGFVKASAGITQFRTATPEQIIEMQRKNKANGRAV